MPKKESYSAVVQPGSADDTAGSAAQAPQAPQSPAQGLNVAQMHPDIQAAIQQFIMSQKAGQSMGGKQAAEADPDQVAPHQIEPPEQPQQPNILQQIGYPGTPGLGSTLGRK